MPYRDDPEARSTLKAAFTGLAVAVTFLLIVGVISFAWAGGFSSPEHAEAEAPGAAAQH